MRSVYSVGLENSSTEVVHLGDGNKFIKQIVKFGKWVDPNMPDQKMSLDKSWAQKIVDNFKSKVVNRVPVPLSHTDLPEFNTGELLSLEIKDDGLYGTLDIRDMKTADAIENDLIWDVSVSFDNQYVNKKTGEVVGPTLLHVALVNNPYLKGMSPFQALANRMNSIMLSESKEQDPIMSVVKNDREFDVSVTVEVDGVEQITVVPAGEEIEVSEEVAEAIKTQIAEAVAPEAKEGEEDKGEDKEGEADDKQEDQKEDGEDKGDDKEDEKTDDAELSELEAAKKELAEIKAKNIAIESEAAYSKYLSEGKIVPAQKEAFIALAAASSNTVNLADGSTKSLSDMLNDLMASAPKRVSFDETGSTGDEQVPETPFDALSDEEKAGLDALGTSKDEYNEIHGNTATKSSNKDEE